MPSKKAGRLLKDEAVGSSIAKCPECGSDKLIRSYERGELTCGRCGYVISEKIVDRGPEWRAFTPEERERKSRVGAPLTLTAPDRSLSTVIDWRGKDALGHKLGLEKRMEVSRWRKWQTRTSILSSIERNFTQAMKELDRIASHINLPKNIKDEAALIYRRALDKGLVRGRSIESIVAGAIYAACRIERLPITLTEIAGYTKAGRKDVSRCYRLILKDADVKIPVIDAADYVTRIGGVLGLSGATQRKAIEIIKEVKSKDERFTAGKDPAGFAAAAVYLASILQNEKDEKKTQKEMARAAQVTEVTVRNRFKEIIEILNIKVLEQ